MLIKYVAPPTVSRFHHSPAAVRGLMGCIGSGKSVGCVMEIYRLISQVQTPDHDGIRRSRVGIIRNTIKELKMTTIKTWMEWMGWSGYLKISDNVFMVEFNDVQAEIIFLGLDRPEQLKALLSLELSYAFINEAREIQFETVQMLRSRLGRYPSKREGDGCTRPCMIMDTNPPSEDGWWFNIFEEQKPDGWELFKQPGGLDPKAENIENLPDGYYTTQMTGNSAAWLKVYRDAQYAFLLEGKAVYPEYKEPMHLLETFIPNPKLPILIGMDFGRTPVAVLGQKDQHGRWVIFDEMQTWDMGATEFGEKLYRYLLLTYPGFRTNISGWGDPAGDDQGQNDDKTPIQIINKAGIKIRPGITQDVFVRTESVRVPLSRIYEGTAALRITPKCRMLRKAMAGGYHYRKINSGGASRYDIKPNKNEYSHVSDALQYLLSSAGEAVGLIKSNRAPVAPITTEIDWKVF